MLHVRGKSIMPSCWFYKSGAVPPRLSVQCFKVLGRNEGSPRLLLTTIAISLTSILSYPSSHRCALNCQGPRWRGRGR